MSFLERLMLTVFVFATLTARASNYDMPITFDILYVVGFVLLVLDFVLDYLHWRERKRRGYIGPERRYTGPERRRD